MLAEILKQINEAEAESDRIFARTKTQIIDIEKDAFAAIEKINSDTDAEIAKQIKELNSSLQTNTEPVKIIAPDKSKMDAAIKYVTEQFLSEYAK